MIVIGISSSVHDADKISLNKINYERILAEGAVPILLPNLEDIDAISFYAKMLDGLLLTGGHDINPLIYDEEPHKYLGEVTPSRDFFEIELTKEMLKINKPILGICRGAQILNVAAGGTLYQDIHSQHKNEILQHQQKAPKNHPSHFIKIKKDTLLYSIVQKEEIKVNTFHHQAVKDLGEHMKISSRAKDLIVESIESINNTFALGVQWHPEYLEDQTSDAIYQAFVKAVKK